MDTGTDLDYKEIGENIRKYRRIRGLKQKELAARIGKTDQHISHIENGSSVSLSTLVKISNVLEVDNTLLGRTQVGAQNAIAMQAVEQLHGSLNKKQTHLMVDICELLKEYFS